MGKVYRIYPSIGFARVGTSSEIFLGPEFRGTSAVPEDKKYRDAGGKLRRQGCRFRVFEFDDEHPEVPPVEVHPGVGQVTRIDWTVHLQNKKAEWFKFAGIVGEGPAGYPPGHLRRNDGVANRRSLIIDPLARQIGATGAAATLEIAKGTSANPGNESWPPAFSSGESIQSLGTLSVDAEGRLTVAGGYGKSGTPGALPPDGELEYDNNDNWFDDVSDGPVNARIHFDGHAEAAASTAWIVVGPPDFAPPIQNLVTVYDLLYDLALRKCKFGPTIFDPLTGKFSTTFTPSFTHDVYPIVRRALQYRWVIQPAAAHTGRPGFDIDRLAAPKSAGETDATNPRLRTFHRIRDPDNLLTEGRANMPLLHNDGIDGAVPETRHFTVTRYQYHVLKQWTAGTFISDWTGAEPPPEAEISPEGLNRASMDAACGGSFFPGMEASWILRDPRVYLDPFEFRFRSLAAEGDNGVSPGDVCKRMALPWQADFHDCGSNWWPAQRPNQVQVGGNPEEWMEGITSHVDLVNRWSQLGIVASDGAGKFVETERLIVRD